MGVSALSVDARRDAGRSVLSLSGELDLATVPTLREAALGELDEPESSGIVLDLEHLTFVDSTGLGCFIELRNHARALGKSLVLDAVPPAARRTLAIAGLAGLFGVQA